MTRIKKSVESLEIRTLLAGEYDEREAIVTIRSGAGGVDAADFAEILMRMYTRWAEHAGAGGRRRSTPHGRRYDASGQGMSRTDRIHAATASDDSAGTGDRPPWTVTTIARSVVWASQIDPWPPRPPRS